MNHESSDSTIIDDTKETPSRMSYTPHGEGCRVTGDVQPKWPACGVDYYPDRRYAEAHCGNGHYAVGHGDEERATTEAYRAMGRSHAAAREAGDPICDACVRMSSDATDDCAAD